MKAAQLALSTRLHAERLMYCKNLLFYAISHSGDVQRPEADLRNVQIVEKEVGDCI